MSYTCNNPKELKDAILRRLGAPIINIEVTEDQIYDCIQRAMELYGEYHYDGLNKSYMAFVLTEQQAKDGLVVLENPYNVYAVTKLLRSKSGCIGSFGGTPYTWFQDFINGLAGGGKCNTFSKFGDGMSMYVGVSSYFNLLRDIIDPIPDYWFNATNGQLKLFGKFKEGDVVIAEVFIKSFVPLGSSRSLVGSSGFTIGSSYEGETNELGIYEDPFSEMSARFKIGQDSSEFLNQNVYNVRWVKDFSTALVKELNGSILARHQGMMLPGGVTVDGTRLIQEAKEEIEALMNELYLLEEPLPLLMG